MCVGGAGRRGGQDLVTVSVGGVERSEEVEIGGEFSVEEEEEVVDRET